MIRKIIIGLILIFNCLLLVCCRNNEFEEKEIISDTITKKDESIKDEVMKNIEIKVGDLTYEAALYNNDSVEEFIKLLPIAITMNELNGNEKYFYLDNDIINNPSKVNEIHTGDLMLYSSDCLVLFYEDFKTSYSYTPLGYIKNLEGLKEALTSGNVQVSFSR